MLSISLASALLVQLFWATLASAAPVVDETLMTTGVDNTWTYGTGGGILGFIVLILDIIVFSEFSPVLGHPSA